MNIRFLHTFCTVLDTGSLAGAARLLGLAHASVSEQVRSLESSLGATLVIRQGQTVVPTAAGRAIYDTAREIVARSDELRHLANAGHLRGRLRVGAISTALVSLMPSALLRMTDRFPEIEIKVVPGTSATLMTALEAGEIDCAVVVAPPFALSKSFAWTEVRKEPLVLIAQSVPEGTGIPELLRERPFIRIDKGAWSGRLVQGYLDEKRLTVKELFELDAMETILILVSENLGVALLPNWGICPPAGKPVDILPTDAPNWSRSVGVVVRRGAAASLAQAFSSVICSIGEERRDDKEPREMTPRRPKIDARTPRAVRAGGVVPQHGPAFSFANNTAEGVSTH